jgi:hypothetical protein
MPEAARMRGFEFMQLSLFDPLVCPALNRVLANPLPEHPKNGHIGEGVYGSAVINRYVFFAYIAPVR